MKPRRSPRKHGSLQNAVKENPPVKGSKQSAPNDPMTSKQNTRVRNTSTHRTFARVAVTSKSVIKSSPRAENKSNTVVQSKARRPKRPKAADPALNLKSTRQLRPRSRQKPSTRSFNRAKQSLRGSTSGLRGKRHSVKAQKIRKDPDIGQFIPKKVSSKSTTGQNLTPVENTPESYSIRYQPRPIQEDQCTSEYYQPLTKDALKELDQQLQSINKSDQLQDKSSQESSIDSRERFNRKWGYVPPLDERTVRIIEAITKKPARAQTMVGIGPEKEEFVSGLGSRNVLLEPSAQLDPYQERI